MKVIPHTRMSGTAAPVQRRMKFETVRNRGAITPIAMHNAIRTKSGISVFSFAILRMSCVRLRPQVFELAKVPGSA
jgi:hypothetical protein